MVMSVDHPGLTFNLTLVRSEPTYNQPVQQWTFTSDFAVSVSARSCVHCVSLSSAVSVIQAFYISVTSAPHR